MWSMETRGPVTQAPVEVHLTQQTITSIQNWAEESSGDELTEDTKTLIRNRAEESIGYITIDGGCGTGFRVGHTYLMSVFHVFSDKIDEFIDNIIFHLDRSGTPRNILLSTVKNTLNADIAADSDEDFTTAARHMFRHFLNRTAYNTEQLVTKLKDIVDTGPLQQRLKYQWTENCHIDFINHGRFYIDWKIIFGNEKTDIIIVNLLRKETYQIYPVGMLLDEEYRQHCGILLIRYIHNNPPKIVIDQSCHVFDSDAHLERAVKDAIEWWERNFPNEDEGIFTDQYKECCKAIDRETGRVILKSSGSFIEGSSGSPVIYMLNNDAIPAVTMIYQGGYPPFYYTPRARRFHSENIDSKCFFGRAITLKILVDILNDDHKTRLKQLLFSPEAIEKGIRREEVMTENMKKWEKEDTYFFETEVSKVILNKISDDKCHSLSVIGVRGSGKTAAIRHAAVCLQNRKGFTVYPILERKTFAATFYRYFIRGVKQLFVFDDPVGSNNVEPDMVTMWDDHYKYIDNCLSKETKFLFSLRSEADKHEHLKYDAYIFNIKDRIIDLTLPENSLRIDDMKGIFESLLRKNQLSFPEDTLLNAVSTCNGANSRCFPTLCKIFCEEKSLRENIETYFEYPFLGMVRFFQEMKTRNIHQYCGLLMCAVFENHSMDRIFDYRNLDTECARFLNTILEDMSLKTDDLKTIQRELKSINNVYVENIETNVTFVHSLYKDIVLYLTKNSDFVFKHGSSQLIKERVRVNRRLCNDDQFVDVYSDDCLEKLADRLIQDVWKDKLTGFSFLAHNHMIDDEIFFLYIKKKLSEKIFTRIPVIKSFHQPSFLQIFKTEKSFLHISVSSGSLRLTQYLVCFLGNISDVKLILHSACRAPSNNIKLVKLLQMHGAVLNELTDNTSESVLHYAIRYTDRRCCELSKYLLQKGFSAQARNKSNESVLHYIAKYGKKSNAIKLANLFIRYGAPLHVVDKDGRSILHYTARYLTESQAELARLFVKHGAPVNALDKDGQSVLDYTTCFTTDNRVELTEIFRSSGRW